MIEPIRLTFSDIRPTYWNTVQDEIEWMKEIEAATEGRVKFKFISGRAAGKPAEQYRMMQERYVDIINQHPSYSAGVFPISTDLDCLPFTYPSAEIAAKVVNEIYIKYCANTEFKSVKVLWAQLVAPLQIHSTKKPIKTVEDWKGLNGPNLVRPLLREIQSAFGATATFAIGNVETYDFLKDGILDYAFYSYQPMVAGIGKVQDKKDFASATKYRTHCNIMTKGWPILMDIRTWNKLPSDIRQIIDKLSGPERSAWAGKRKDAEDAHERELLEAYDKIAGNPPIFELPADERQKWMEISAPVIDKWATELEAQGIPGKAILRDVHNLVAKYSK